MQNPDLKILEHSADYRLFGISAVKRTPTLEISGAGIQTIQQTRIKTVDPNHLLPQFSILNFPMHPRIRFKNSHSIFLGACHGERRGLVEPVLPCFLTLPY